MTAPAVTIFDVARLPRAELIARYLALHPAPSGEYQHLAAQMTNDALTARIWEHTPNPTQENPA